MKIGKEHELEEIREHIKKILQENGYKFIRNDVYFSSGLTYSQFMRIGSEIDLSISVFDIDAENE